MPKARRRPSKPQAYPEPPQRPTPEAQRHGEYVQGNSGGRAVWTNLKPAMLEAYERKGYISKAQAAAGICFRETYTSVHGSPSRRDSTQPWIGGEIHETESQAERWAKNNARTTTILNRVGPSAYSQLVSVVVFDEPVGRYKDNRDAMAQLTASLDQCKIVYGVNDD